MHPPLVSIILPTYNRAEYLSKSIGSAISQTYQNWELLIWDDGSTDQTEMVVRSFSDDRIRYYKGANRGAAQARNQAIAVSKGIYIAFLDSDDTWLTEKLTVQVNALEMHPEIDLIFSDFQNITLETKQEGRGFSQNAAGMNFLRLRPVKENIFVVEGGLSVGLLRSNFIATDSLVVRKSVLQKTGLFNATLRNGEDFELWWRMSLKDICFAFTEQVLLRRVKPSDSLSSPGITTYLNHLACLDYCLHEAETCHRVDLIPLFKPAYRTAWQGLIRQYAIMGERKKAVQAFLHSRKYGISWRSIYLIIGALVGPRMVNRIRKTR